MMRALLMAGDRLLKIAEMCQVMPFLRYGVSSEYILPTSSDNSTSTAICNERPLFRQDMVFRLSRRVGFDTYEYQYEYTPRNQSFAFAIYEGIGWGLQEPDENINLKKLRRKLRSKKKMKELLLKYYKS